MSPDNTNPAWPKALGMVSAPVPTIKLNTKISPTWKNKQISTSVHIILHTTLCGKILTVVGCSICFLLSVFCYLAESGTYSPDWQIQSH